MSVPDHSMKVPRLGDEPPEQRRLIAQAACDQVHQRSIGHDPHSTDLVLPCMLFAIFGMGLVSFLILQGELNKHWELHHSSHA